MLRVNCVQGTAGLLPLISLSFSLSRSLFLSLSLSLRHTDTQRHTHTHKNTHLNTPTQYRCRGALVKVPMLQMKERKGENQIRTGAVSHHTADRGDRQEVERWIILRSLTGLKASQDPHRDHLHWWRTWTGCTSYGCAGSAGRTCL